MYIHIWCFKFINDMLKFMHSLCWMHILPSSGCLVTYITCGVDVQVGYAWSTWVLEDDMLPIILRCLCYWSLNCRALIRCRGFIYFVFVFIFLRNPWVLIDDVFEMLRQWIYVVLCFDSAATILWLWGFMTIFD